MNKNNYFEDKYTINFSNRVDKNGEDDIFVQRWSPRSFENKELEYSVYESIFGAARWTQSCFNEQPWLFVTESGKQDRELFENLLLPGNRKWAQNASLIGYIFCRRNFRRNNKPNRWAGFDTGASWMAITLQARLYGLYTHGMAGIDKEKVYSELNVSEENYEILCGFVIGVIDTPEKLDEDSQKREVPSARKDLSEIWHRGKLKK
ncbi:MAG: nitroreductase family protein [Spirochaetaceae bacterium]|nr:nitroreductase family protein [Spirochaetaceae bacterium]